MGKVEVCSMPFVHYFYPLGKKLYCPMELDDSFHGGEFFIPASGKNPLSLYGCHYIELKTQDKYTTCAFTINNNSITIPIAIGDKSFYTVDFHIMKNSTYKYGGNKFHPDFIGYDFLILEPNNQQELDDLMDCGFNILGCDPWQTYT